MEQQREISLYRHAAEVIKDAILQGQYEALKNENRIQLAVYFSIGKYVSENTRQGKWGTGATKAISDNLRKFFHGLRGFSAENLRKMRQFYEEWSALAVVSSSVKSEHCMASSMTESSVESNLVFANTKFASS